MAKNAPLLQDQGGGMPHLYDPASMLGENMDVEVARGFVVLLGGQVERRNQKLSSRLPDVDENAVALGFLALTEGNTIEACFGVNHMTAPADNHQQGGKKQAQQVKALLGDAVDSNENVRPLSVATYQNAFRIVYAFCLKKKSLNVFTKCFCYRRLYNKATLALEKNFEQLQEAIQATTR